MESGLGLVQKHGAQEDLLRVLLGSGSAAEQPQVQLKW